MDRPTVLILNHRTEFLQFLRNKFRLYHRSNLFFRDIHYGVSGFLEQYGIRLGYAESEALARDVIQVLVADRIFKEIDSRTWMLDYEEFRKPSTKTPAASKPAITSQQSPKKVVEPPSQTPSSHSGVIQEKNAETKL